MEKSYGHKVDKYALIYTAADEISTYLRDIEDRPAKYMDFYMKQIDKAATFIRFVESVCIISGAELLTRVDIDMLWGASLNQKQIEAIDCDVYVDAVSLTVRFAYEGTARRIAEMVKKFQKQCAEKQFATLTAPF